MVMASEYSEKLRQWNLAVAEHVGIDPEQVTRLEVTKSTSVPEMFERVAWDAIELQPETLVGQRGIDRRTATGDDEFTSVQYHGEILLSFDEGRALYADVGPEPEILTRAQRLQLLGALAEDQGFSRT